MEPRPDRLEMPSHSADIYDRIRYLIRLLRHNQASFAKAIGVDAANISRVLSGRSAPSESLINRIVVNLGVSKQWLTEGSDVPFPRSTPKVDNGRGAPVYDIDVSAGTTPFARMFTDERPIGSLNLPGIDPSLPIVRVSGDSMSPRLKPGCYISIREVSLSAPKLWGRIYVVVTQDFRFVKYLRRNDDPSLVTLASDNPNYEDIELPVSQIEGLYLVENAINYDFIA